MLDTPFSSWPSYSTEEVQAVANVVASNRVNYWTGTECRKFETEFADWCRCEHSVALVNGTLALDVALKAIDIGEGDEVIVTPRSFVASASCVVTAGGVPVFADVDRDTQNLSAETIARVISPRTKAIICVHLAGMPCDMDPIVSLARAHDLRLIEDCAQAHGAHYKGRSVGTIGDIGAWSFCQDKIMSTGGEGGMVTTNDKSLWLRMWSYKDHGKSWDAVYGRTHAPGFRWIHESFGTNWRMLEIQGAIGRIQLRHMKEWSACRTANAARIAQTCQQFPVVRVPTVPAYATHAYYRMYAFVQPQQLASGWTRDRIVKEINGQGVSCFQGACPEIYLEKAFDGTGFRPAYRLSVARELGETSLSFLVHPTLTDAEIRTMQEVIADVLGRAGASNQVI